MKTANTDREISQMKTVDIDQLDQPNEDCRHKLLPVLSSLRPASVLGAVPFEMNRERGG